MKFKSLNNFDLIIFDSDGIVLNSNHLKVETFYEISNEINEKDFHSKILDFINANQNATRVEIISFIINLNNKLNDKEDEIKLLKYLKFYSDSIVKKLSKAEINRNIIQLKKNSFKNKWLVLTAGDQKETIDIYKERNLYSLFEHGIFGSPNTKQENIFFINKNIFNLENKKILFIGDSIKDAIIAKKNNFEFIYVKEWSICEQCLEFCKNQNFYVIESLKELIK